MRDSRKMNQIRSLRGRDNGLGPNSAIGTRLRALYGGVEQEEVPGHILDLLERLDAVERSSADSAPPNATVKVPDAD